MIISPVSDLDVVIRDTLKEVRRGIATARANNQSNPTLGMMADLPEFVEFEIQVITGHQQLQRQSQDVDNEVSTESENNSDLGSDLEISSDTSTNSGFSSTSESGSDSEVGASDSARTSSGQNTTSENESSDFTNTKYSSYDNLDSTTGIASDTSNRQLSSSSSDQGGTADISQDNSDNSRAYGIIDEDTGDYTASGSSGLVGDAPTQREASVECSAPPLPE